MILSLISSMTGTIQTLSGLMPEAQEVFGWPRKVSYPGYMLTQHVLLGPEAAWGIFLAPCWVARHAKSFGCLPEKKGWGCPGIQGSYKEVPAVPGLRHMDDNTETAFPKSRRMEKGCFTEETAPNLAAHQLLNPSLSSEVSFQTHC